MKEVKHGLLLSRKQSFIWYWFIVSNLLSSAILRAECLGPKKYQKIARMYDHTGLSTKCTLIKIDFFRPSDPNFDFFRPFVEALIEQMLVSS